MLTLSVIFNTVALLSRARSLGPCTGQQQRLHTCMLAVSAESPDEVSRALSLAAARVEQALSMLDLPRQVDRVAELEEASTATDFWDDAAAAERTLRKLGEHKAAIADAKAWQAAIEDADAALQLSREMAEEGAAAEETYELMREASSAITSLDDELTK